MAPDLLFQVGFDNILLLPLPIIIFSLFSSDVVRTTIQLLHIDIHEGKGIPSLVIQGGGTCRTLLVLPPGTVKLGVQVGQQPVRRPFLLGLGIFREYIQGGQLAR